MHFYLTYKFKNTLYKFNYIQNVQNLIVILKFKQVFYQICLLINVTQHLVDNAVVYCELNITNITLTTTV